MVLKFIKLKPFTCPGEKAGISSEPLPFEWIKNSLPQKYVIVDFDGGVVNFLYKKVTAFFIKKEFVFDNLEDITDEKIIELYNAEHDERLLERCNISQILDVPLFFISWPKDYPEHSYSEIPKPVFIFQITQQDNKINIKKINQGTVKDLEDFIFSYRQWRIPRVKSLLISKTHMECHLNKTSSPWPGDYDGVIFEKDSQKVLGILEFKTHNLDTPIEDQSITKYSTADVRRFKPLHYLQKNLMVKQYVLPSILYVIWGTKKHHTKIKIQKFDDQKILAEEYVDSPLITQNTNSITSKIIEMCR